MNTASKPATSKRARLLVTAALLSVPLTAGFVAVTSSLASAASGFVALPAPQRVLDTRSGESTSDGQMQGFGTIGAGSTLPIPIKGRVGIAADATAVVLNVTVTQPQDSGFATVYPCDAARPMASNLNYTPGQTIPNLVVATIGSGGDVCLYSSASAHYVVDATGYFPIGSYNGLAAPQRVLDTRPGELTADGQQSGTGALPATTTLTIPVAGRVGIPTDARAAVFNVTVTGPEQSGFATLYPCDVPRPTASNLNFEAGETIPNAAVSKIAADGTVCLYTQSTAHYVIDVAGVLPATTFQPLASPHRLLDTRPGEITSDSQYQGIGTRGAGSSTRIQVAGRAGVPTTATAVVLNVTVTQPQAAGFATVFPTGTTRPTASNLNYMVGDTIPNAVVAKVGVNGSVCLFTQSSAHYVIDVAGYLTGSTPPTSGSDCPAPELPPEPPPPPPSTNPKPPSSSKCDPNYTGACVPIASDVDCAGGSGNGPAYVRGPVYIVGRDIYGLDGHDNDGIGCES